LDSKRQIGASQPISVGGRAGRRGEGRGPESTIGLRTGRLRRCLEQAAAGRGYTPWSGGYTRGYTRGYTPWSSGYTRRYTRGYTRGYTL
jgi:hypothetical protein